MRTSEIRDTFFRAFADLEPRPAQIKVIDKTSLTNSASLGRYISDEDER